METCGPELGVQLVREKQLSLQSILFLQARIITQSKVLCYFSLREARALPLNVVIIPKHVHCKKWAK